jgi:arsenite/tail-anchored protein-transporting ATPase
VSGLTPHLTLGSRWTFVGGKGGVGKTTVAAAVAVELAESGSAVMVLSTDPAHSLGDALQEELSAEPRPLAALPGLQAFEVDAERERLRFLDRHRGSLAALIERGTYLDAEDVREVTGLALPGMDELGALLRLNELAAAFDGRIIVDTAPTGHTLRLLDLPAQALTWLDALDAMEAKHAAVASALVGRYAADAASEFLASLRQDLDRLARTLRDGTATRFVLVTTSEPGVLAETLRYRERLEARGIALAGIVVNRQAGPPPPGATGTGMLYVPELTADLRGIEGLRHFAAAAGPTFRPGAGGAPGPAVAPRLRLGPTFEPPLDRRLYLVGGKGGVGKTTAAAAIAVRLADAGRGRVLLLGVDPAGSLAEVLGAEVGTEAHPVAGVAGLEARQLDPAGAWGAFRDRYRQEVEELFRGLGAGGLSAGYDRAVVTRLVDLAPPGIDELVAMMEVIDLTEDRPYDALVLDTAPTGHLLRLLEMPDLALEWAHTLLRLLLKYRDVISLGGIGERVLKLSRTLRALRTELMDHTHTWFLAVALPESLSVPETGRLLGGLRRLGIVPGAVLVNRALAEERGEIRGEAVVGVGRLLEIDPETPFAAAAETKVGPAGVPALRAFLDGWRRVAHAG